MPSFWIGGIERSRKLKIYNTNGLGFVHFYQHRTTQIPGINNTYLRGAAFGFEGGLNILMLNSKLQGLGFGIRLFLSVVTRFNYEDSSGKQRIEVNRSDGEQLSSFELTLKYSLHRPSKSIPNNAPNNVKKY